jgi:DNA replication protein
MEKFAGFPARMQFTPVPNAFFSNLLPQIGDIAELKTTLQVLAMLYRQRGYPRFIPYHQLLASKSLMSGLSSTAAPPEQSLRRALEMATRRGTLLSLSIDRDGAVEDIYFLNDEPSRQAIAKIQKGELKLPVVEGRQATDTSPEEPPDIFNLYEQNVGMLTPMIAEELREAERLYPQTWINGAIKEAVAANKRNWRYIAAILERWATEGKESGTYKRDSKRQADPDKYIKGKYGHMVQR